MQVELNEVEYHLQHILLTVRTGLKLAVEVAKPRDSDISVLVAFVAMLPEDTDRSKERFLSDLVVGIEDDLPRTIPAFMIPSAWIALDRIPLSGTGKTDRKHLRDIINDLSLEQLTALRPDLEDNFRAPETPQEHELRDVFAQVLNIDAHSISAEASFIRLGGDSIMAMRLVALARQKALELTVPNVLGSPRLTDLAKLARHISNVDADIDEPFSLLGTDIDVANLRQQIGDLCNVFPASVENAYPCAALQVALLAMSARNPSKYVYQEILELADVDLDLFKKAWNSVFATTPILRTRIIELRGHSLTQVVVDESIDWFQYDSIEDAQLSRPSFGLGGPLHSFGLVSEKDTKRHYFVRTLHHALYDRFTVALLDDQLERTYSGNSLRRLAPFSRFVRHIEQGKNVRDGEAKAADLTFWEERLRGSTTTPFPIMPTPNYQPRPNSAFDLDVELQWTQSDVTPSTFIHLAWSLILSRHTALSDIIYGTIVSGREVETPEIELIAGPTIASIPVRTSLQPEISVRIALEQIQRDLISIVPYAQAGLQRIQRLSEDAYRACAFKTILLIQPEEETLPASTLFRNTDDREKRDTDQLGSFSSHELMVVCQFTKQGLKFRLIFDDKVQSRTDIRRLAFQLEIVMRQLVECHATTKTIGEIEILSEDELLQIWAWNASVPQTIEARMHDLIEEVAAKQPTAQAIESWDGKLSYSELSAMSTRVAEHLIGLGVAVGDVVELRFEKSMYMPIAQIGVIKAGAACLSMDIKQPEARTQSILDQVQPRLTICSETQLASIYNSTRTNCMSIGASFFSQSNVPSLPKFSLPNISARSPLYLHFTSGSTSVPKGVEISHANFASSIFHQLGPLGFTSTSRIFDYASYAFDPAYGNLFRALCAGGTLCIPSESDRQHNIAGAISALSANQASFTPTVARLIQPKDVPSLEVLRFGGEALSTADVARFKGIKTIQNVYGPAEATPITFSNTITDVDSLNHDIGHGLGVCGWVVDLASSSLAVIGGIGELWLEGPLVSNGYYKLAEKTASSFVVDPPWLLRGAPGGVGRHGTMYRTGDIVRFCPDGTLVFVGRRDDEVKISGMRQDVGEVEGYLRSCIPTEHQMQLAVDVITPRDSEDSLLVAFFEPKKEDRKFEFADVIAAVDDRLTATLPNHMIPKVWVPTQIPLLPSGKVDRRAIRQLGASLSRQELVAKCPPRTTRREPTTEAELQLVGLWCNILGLDPSTVSADDSWLRVGGDSVTAMRLVAAARKANPALHFTVGDVFKHPRLSELASTTTSGPETGYERVKAFSLLPEDVNLNEVKRQVADACQDVRPSQVEDIFQTLPFQRGLLSLSTSRPGDYVAKIRLELRSDVDIDGFRKAWEDVVAHIPILRTRIVDIDGLGLVQAIIQQSLEWHTGFCDKDRQMRVGTALAQVALDQDDGRTVFTLLLHHACYDADVLPNLIEAAERVYQGELLPTTLQYQEFVRYVQAIDTKSAASFWAKQLDSPEAAQFPDITPMGSEYQPRADMRKSYHFSNMKWRSSESGLTTANAIRAAWALLLAHLTNTDDALFGVVVSGRQAPVAGILDIIAPTIATVPVRVRLLDRGSTPLRAFIEAVQEQALDMTPFEQVGLPFIQSISSDAAQCCKFQSLLLVQPLLQPRQSLLFTHTTLDDDDSKEDRFSSHALLLSCAFASDHIQLRISVDTNVLPEYSLDRLMAQFETVLRKVFESDLDAVTIAEVEVASPQDVQQIYDINKFLPERVDECVHDIISATTRKQPEAEAICAWNGSLTYIQLDESSTLLAHHLLQRTPGRETAQILPLLFEKSMYLPLAKLAVMKAGFAAVALDGSHPDGRLRAIVDQVNAKTVLSSSEYQHRARNLHANVVVVDAQLLERIPSMSNATLPKTKPSALCYINYTSGSTGLPKGVQISHSAFASQIRHQQKALRFTNKSRVYDWVACAFDVVWSNLIHTLAAGGCLCKRVAFFQCLGSIADRSRHPLRYRSDAGHPWIDGTLTSQLCSFHSKCCSSRQTDPHAGDFGVQRRSLAKKPPAKHT